jgi:hypothetical protein
VGIERSDVEIKHMDPANEIRVFLSSFHRHNSLITLIPLKRVNKFHAISFTPLRRTFLEQPIAYIPAKFSTSLMKHGSS